MLAVVGRAGSPVARGGLRARSGRALGDDARGGRGADRRRRRRGPVLLPPRAAARGRLRRPAARRAGRAAPEPGACARAHRWQRRRGLDPRPPSPITTTPRATSRRRCRRPSPRPGRLAPARLRRRPRRCSTGRWRCGHGSPTRDAGRRTRLRRPPHACGACPLSGGRGRGGGGPVRARARGGRRGRRAGAGGDDPAVARDLPVVARPGGAQPRDPAARAGSAQRRPRLAGTGAAARPAGSLPPASGAVQRSPRRRARGARCDRSLGLRARPRGRRQPPRAGALLPRRGAGGRGSPAGIDRTRRALAGTRRHRHRLSQLRRLTSPRGPRSRGARHGAPGNRHASRSCSAIARSFARSDGFA